MIIILEVLSTHEGGGLMAALTFVLGEYGSIICIFL